MKTLQEILQLEQFNNLEFIAKQVVEGFVTGLHRSPFHGFSVEFAEHRLYNTGESTRFIDWKLYARTEKLFVKRFEEETNLRSQIVIDTSSSMLFPYKEAKKENKLTFSIYCAAALVHLLKRQRDASGLTLFSDKIELLTESKLSSVHSKMIYSELEKLLSEDSRILNKPTSTSDVLHELAENIKRRSLVIIFSDLFESESPEKLFSALQHLKYNKHEVVLFHVVDNKLEKEFEFNGKPHKFVDLETGEEVKLNPWDVKSYYKQKVSEYLTEIKTKAGQFGIDIIDADINSDFRSVLLPYLIKRSNLY